MKRTSNTTLTIAAICMIAGGFCTADETREQAERTDYEKLVDSRIEKGLEFVCENPWPNPAEKPLWKLRHAYILTWRRGEAGSLNKAILDYCKSYKLDQKKAPTAYHDPRPQAVLYSIYLKPELHKLLTAETRDAIEDVCWRWVYRHSFISKKEKWPLNNPTKSVWYISGSENHCASQRAANLLSLQVLLKAGAPYGPDAKLHDGHTVAEHYREWVRWYPEFFRQRMREGLTCEIAHPSSYGNATFNRYYEIEDLTGSAEVKQAARDFLDLFWANVACEFEPRTGIRASIASTRCYKWSWTQNGIYWAHSLLYSYGWTDVKRTSNLTQVSLFTCGYRPPEILRAIARDEKRGPYMGTSRRFGRAVGGWDKGLYKVIFDDGPAHNSYMRRDTWYTQDYTMSALSLDPGRNYIELVDQSRVMGVTFSSDIGDRLVVYAGNKPASKKVEYKMTTSKGVNGVLGPDCLIVARDPNADAKKSNGTRVFVSDGALWDNREEDDSGWFFTRAGDGYAAFRVPGGYVAVPSPYENGFFVEFRDIWAPVVIQMAQAGEHDSFAAFKAAVKAKPVTYTGGKVTYEALNGDTYEYQSKSKAPPKINGKTIDLNPAMAYDYPYLKMKHGDDRATITYPGYPDLSIPASNKSQAK